jgi:RNA polymerase sigma factor (sigma-70 family)
MGTSGEVPDEELMTRFCQGDAQAFDALFERHGRAVHAYLTRLVGSGAAAEDLAQATFLSLVRSRGRFHPAIQFRPWLYAIATNAARDHFRRGRREQLTEKGELPADAAAEDPAPTDAGLERRVRSALEQIPAQQREVIVLNRFHGLSMAEVAVAVGASETAVKVRAHRGYERLRRLLSDLWDAWKEGT